MKVPTGHFRDELMLRIILATVRPDAFRSFAEAMSKDQEVSLDLASSGAETVGIVRTHTPHLVIIDFELPDTESLSLVKELLAVNAFVNTAVVSSLSEQEFHDASEGLGVLARLPVNPGESEATELLEKLRGVMGR